MFAFFCKEVKELQFRFIFFRTSKFTELDLDCDAWKSGIQHDRGAHCAILYNNSRVEGDLEEGDFKGKRDK